jgi:hypothetical protein
MSGVIIVPVRYREMVYCGKSLFSVNSPLAGTGQFYKI